MQFQLNDNKVALILCLLGIAFGLAIGNFIKDEANSFHSVEIASYVIPPLISFGLAAGLAVQLASVFLSWTTLYWSNNLYQNTDLYYSWIIEILISIPLGVLIIFNIFSGYSVSLGFVVSYAIDLILSPIVMIFVGWHTMHLLLFNAILLLPLYIVSTAIIWLVEFGRSLV
jgi:hypothetical protein